MKLVKATMVKLETLDVQSGLSCPVISVLQV